MSEQKQSDAVIAWVKATCPKCGWDVHIGLMSLAASCPCGTYYVDWSSNRGWYESADAYQEGAARLAEAAPTPAKDGA